MFFFVLIVMYVYGVGIQARLAVLSLPLCLTMVLAAKQF